MKLLSEYPLISLHFYSRNKKLADYLTRQVLPKGDLEKLSLKNVSVQDFYEKLPKQEFTLTEWAQFCADNPQYLTVNNPSVNYITMSLTKGIDNIKRLSDPIDVLKDRLSRANIIKNQKKKKKVEFNDIYPKCLIVLNMLILQMTKHDISWF